MSQFFLLHIAKTSFLTGEGKVGVYFHIFLLSCFNLVLVSLSSKLPTAPCTPDLPLFFPYFFFYFIFFPFSEAKTMLSSSQLTFSRTFPRNFLSLFPAEGRHKWGSQGGWGRDSWVRLKWKSWSEYHDWGKTAHLDMRLQVPCDLKVWCVVMLAPHILLRQLLSLTPRARWKNRARAYTYPL